MNGQYPQKNVLGQLAIVLHAHLPYVRKNEKNSLEEDWLFQAILECYIPLLQSIESSKNENPLNTKLTISLSPTLLSLLNNKKIQETFLLLRSDNNVGDKLIVSFVFSGFSFLEDSID